MFFSVCRAAEKGLRRGLFDKTKGRGGDRQNQRLMPMATYLENVLVECPMIFSARAKRDPHNLLILFPFDPLATRRSPEFI